MYNVQYNILVISEFFVMWYCVVAGKNPVGVKYW